MVLYVYVYVRQCDEIDNTGGTGSAGKNVE